MSEYSGSGSKYSLSLNASINTDQIKEQLEKIAKNYVLNLKINVETNGIKEIEERVDNVRKNINNSNNSKIRIIDTTTTLTDIDLLKAKVQDIKNDISKDAKLDIKMDDKGNIVRAIYTMVDDTSKKVKEVWVPAFEEVNGKLVRTNKLALDQVTYSDDYIAKEKEKEKQLQRNIELAKQLGRENYQNAQQIAKETDSTWKIKEKEQEKKRKEEAKLETAYQEQLIKSRERMEELEAKAAEKRIQEEKKRYEEKLRLLQTIAEWENKARDKQEKEEKRINEQRKKDLQELALQADKFLEKAKFLDTNHPEVSKGVSVANQMKQAISANDVDQAKELGRQLSVINEGVRTGGKNLQGWSQELGIALKRTLEWASAVNLLFTAIGQFKEGIQYVKELNKEMTNIQLLQAEGAQTNGQINNLAKEYNNLAKEMGATTLEVAKGSVEWLRQGKSISETEELLRSTMMLSKLGALDSAQATELLTSTLNGFNISADKSVDVVSKLVKFCQNT